MKALCFPCSGCSRESSDHASAERTERTLFLMRLINRLDYIEEHMGSEDWQSFSGELHDRILPVANPNEKLKKTDLEKIAEGIREQCTRWAERDHNLGGVVDQAKEDSVTLALPKRWREDQELVNQFHRLARRLGEGGAAGVADLESGTGYMKVGVFFYTDRESSNNLTPSSLFTTNRARKHSSGIVKISLPDYNEVAKNHKQLPYLWAHSPRRATGKNSNSPEVVSCAILDVGHHLKQCIRFGGGRREAIVFIHGFNVSMKWSAKQMGIYAYKLGGEAPIILYEWPSFEAYSEYGGDMANAMWSVPHFLTFLKGLMTSYDLQKVHLFAHSLGSLIVLHSLRLLAQWKPPRGAARLGQLIMAAPDFDTGEFFELQGNVSKQVERITIYCSSNDKPLNLSRKVHGGMHRLGHFNVEVYVAESRHVAPAHNVHVIDATGLDKSLAGHTYAFTHPGLMDDVCEVLRGETKRPRISPQEKEGFRYYSYVGRSDHKESRTENEVAGDSLDTSS